MTESEYINLGNLTKMRIAASIISGVLSDGNVVTEAELTVLARQLDSIVQKLTAVVKTRR